MQKFFGKKIACAVAVCVGIIMAGGVFFAGAAAAKTPTSVAKNIGANKAYKTGTITLAVYLHDEKTNKDTRLSSQKLTYTYGGSGTPTVPLVYDKQSVWKLSLSGSLSADKKTGFVLAPENSTIKTYKNTDNTEQYWKFLTAKLSLKAPMNMQYYKFGIDQAGRFRYVTQKAYKDETHVSFRANGNASNDNKPITGIKASASDRTLNVPVTINTASSGLRTTNKKRYMNTEIDIYLTRGSKKATVTLDSNGGKVSVSKKTGLLGTKMTLPTPTRTGYTFTGWTKDKAGKEAAGSTYVKSETYYAQWKANVFTVKFNANGASGNAPKAMNVTYAKKTAAPGAGNLTVSGRVFEGWNTKTDGTGTTYRTGDDLSKAAVKNGASVTLYADFSVKNASKLKNVPDDQKIEYSTKKTIKDISVTPLKTSRTLVFQKYNKKTKEWMNIAQKTVTPKSPNVNFTYPINTTTADYRIAALAGDNGRAVIKKWTLTVTMPAETISLQKYTSGANKGKVISFKEDGKRKYNKTVGTVHKYKKEWTGKTLPVKMVFKKGYVSTVNFYMSGKKVSSVKISSKTANKVVTFTLPKTWNDQRIRNLSAEMVVPTDNGTVKYKKFYCCLHTVDAQERLVKWFKSYEGTTRYSAKHKYICKMTKTTCGYSLGTSEAWCAAFVSLGSYANGLLKEIPTDVNCGGLRNKAIRMNKWKYDTASKNYKAAKTKIEPGDVFILCGYGSNGVWYSCLHTGFVWKVTGKRSFRSMEGNTYNTINGVYYRSICTQKTRYGANMHGFIQPAFKKIKENGDIVTS